MQTEPFHCLIPNAMVLLPLPPHGSHARMHFYHRLSANLPAPSLPSSLRHGRTPLSRCLSVLIAFPFVTIGKQDRLLVIMQPIYIYLMIHTSSAFFTSTFSIKSGKKLCWACRSGRRQAFRIGVYFQVCGFGWSGHTGDFFRSAERPSKDPGKIFDEVCRRAAKQRPEAAYHITWQYEVLRTTTTFRKRRRRRQEQKALTQSKCTVKSTCTPRTENEEMNKIRSNPWVEWMTGQPS